MTSRLSAASPAGKPLKIPKDEFIEVLITRAAIQADGMWKIERQNLRLEEIPWKSAYGQPRGGQTPYLSFFGTWDMI
ncbi:hypothetical protein M7I_2103 [Glarea lozoyensis 74030]|uniref:Uncharacterized protein n=1 Tax=Glarea lozoyensis (strain ATCC 74030 / MF5533) TaxID=1104152 RepID=H0EHW2_GLAL7|nr:hypothetical protein M7I_2103 [Glarea lozoyensis 74030]